MLSTRMPFNVCIDFDTCRAQAVILCFFFFSFNSTATTTIIKENDFFFLLFSIPPYLCLATHALLNTLMYDKPYKKFHTVCFCFSGSLVTDFYLPPKPGVFFFYTQNPSKKTTTIHLLSNKNAAGRRRGEPHLQSRRRTKRRREFYIHQ